MEEIDEIIFTWDPDVAFFDLNIYEGAYAITGRIADYARAKGPVSVVLISHEDDQHTIRQVVFTETTRDFFLPGSSRHLQRRGI